MSVAPTLGAAGAEAGSPSLPRRAWQEAGRHRALLFFVGLAVLVRVAVAVAYRPALFFGGDSSQYLKLAFAGGPVGTAYERPSGYPLLLDGLFGLTGRSLLALTTVQHVAGIAVGVLTYVLLRRLDAPRWLAVAAGALVLLDSYSIALEQHVLTDTFFALALLGSFLLVIGRRRGRWALVAGGLLLGVSATLRTVSLFAVPVWLLYVLWAHGGARALALAALAVALPLAGYASWHAAHTGRFGLTAAGGWFLYGRIGEIGDCRGVDVPPASRPLCARTANDERQGKADGPAYYLWNRQGTAHRAFGSLTGGSARQARVNGAMRSFALAIIAERPLAYARLVSRDALQYFEPGVRSLSIEDTAVQLPPPGQLEPPAEPVRRAYFPRLQLGVHEPASAARTYARWVHAPRWLMGALVVASVLALLAGLGGRARAPRRRETFLLSGATVAMLIGATATSEYNLRYLIPMVPLLLGGGLAAALDLASLAGARARRPTLAPASS